MADKYQPNEKVFAKLKGFPPWPGKIVERATGKEEKYRIVFYGTHDEATVKLDQLFKYNEQTKAKYAKTQRKGQFKEAMDEIEAEFLNDSEVQDTEMEPAEGNLAESEGELQIDEGPPSLPPILTAEVAKPEVTEATGNKAKRPRTLTKRDSINSASGVASIPPPVVTPPSTPDINQSSTEIVSRSGRKIKPKRFADDEITSPATAGPKGSKSAPEEGGPPAKKSKRASTTSKSTANKNTASTPILAPASPAPDTQEEVDMEPPMKPKVTPAKGKASTPSVKPSGRLSPDISSPMNSRGPPLLKAAPVGRSGSSGNKQLPTLTPTAPKRKSERQTRSKSIEEPEVPPTLPTEVDENEIDKENSNLEQPTDDAESTHSSDVVSDKKQAKSAEPEEPTAPVEKTVKITDKNGMKYELSYELNNPDAENEEQNKAWQAIAKENVKKLKEDLIKADIESQDIINCTAESIEPLTIDEAKSREKRSLQIRLLRLEGEVIEIIGEIVGSLSVSSADCSRAIELLERLESHQLNPLMLKKHPEVVQTIKRLRCYIGNVEAWGYNQEQKELFDELALTIRQKAVNIYKHFEDLFCSAPDDSFMRIFQDEVEKFRAKIQELPLKTVLGLTDEAETGELDGFLDDMNGVDEDVEDE